MSKVSDALSQSQRQKGSPDGQRGSCSDVLGKPAQALEVGSLSAPGGVVDTCAHPPGPTGAGESGKPRKLS